MSEADDAKSTSNRTKKPQGKNQPKKKQCQIPELPPKERKPLRGTHPHHSTS